MTGYGRAERTLADKKIIAEIKALNGKQYSLIAKFPESYNSKEIEIRNLVTEKLVNGKVSLTLRIEGETAGDVKINDDMLNRYYAHISKAMRAHGHEPQTEQIFQIILRIPDVYSSTNEDVSEDEWTVAKSCLLEAIEHTDKFRREEGKMLERDVLQKIESIKSQLLKIEPFESERNTMSEQRLRQKLEDHLTSEDSKNRFEQELIYFLDKFDINEEKTRLSKHLEYFAETAYLPESQGNKLGFIVQEIGREINTIGSKANHAEIQKIVVQMKDELGKIKEQTMNIL